MGRGVLKNYPSLYFYAYGNEYTKAGETFIKQYNGRKYTDDLVFVMLQ